jgi:hypothetical protein
MSSSLALAARRLNERFTSLRCRLWSGGSALSRTAVRPRAARPVMTSRTSGSSSTSAPIVSAICLASTGPVAVRLLNSSGCRLTNTMSS